MEQNRWKSKVLWTGILSLVVSFMIQIGVIDTGTGDVINQVVSGVLTILGIYGVVNNPTNATGL